MLKRENTKSRAHEREKLGLILLSTKRQWTTLKGNVLSLLVGGEWLLYSRNVHV